jgi:hypothetical protein
MTLKKNGIDAVEVAIAVMKDLRNYTHEQCNETLNEVHPTLYTTREDINKDIQDRLSEYKILTEAIIILNNYTTDD